MERSSPEERHIEQKEITQDLTSISDVGTANIQSPNINRRILLLSSRPQGAPKAKNFSVVEQNLPSLGQGEVLLRTLYLSLDP